MTCASYLGRAHRALAPGRTELKVGTSLGLCRDCAGPVNLRSGCAPIPRPMVTETEFVTVWDE